MKRTSVTLALALAALAFGQAADAPKKNPNKAAAKKAALPEGVKVLRDLEYARPDGKPQLLDLYLPEKAGPSLPVIVWVHGGGWNAGSKDRCPGLWLVPAGYAVASINYRLSTEAQWPAQINDCHAAVRWLRANAANYNFDSARVAAWGGSAGGHLVALMGTLDAPSAERVQAVVDWYGPSDLLTMPPNVLSEKRTRGDLAKANGAQLLGGIVMDRPDQAKSASAIYHASKDDPPFLLMHGDADPQVPLEQSQRLYEALKNNGVPATLHILKGAGHGGPQFSTPEAQQMIREFFGKHLKTR